MCRPIIFSNRSTSHLFRNRTSVRSLHSTLAAADQFIRSSTGKRALSSLLLQFRRPVQHNRGRRRSRLFKICDDEEALAVFGDGVPIPGAGEDAGDAQVE